MNEDIFDFILGVIIEKYFLKGSICKEINNVSNSRIVLLPSIFYSSIIEDKNIINI